MIGFYSRYISSTFYNSSSFWSASQCSKNVLVFQLSSPNFHHFYGEFQWLQCVIEAFIVIFSSILYSSDWKYRKNLLQKWQLPIYRKTCYFDILHVSILELHQSIRLLPYIHSGPTKSIHLAFFCFELEVRILT